MLVYVSTVANAFVANSSLRGVGKFYKTKHRFLKILWLLFILTMVGIFINGLVSIIKEYFQFKTTMQRHRILHEKTNFPSISVCSLQPFGQQANELWSSGSVRSPAEFTNALRALMGTAVEEKQWSLASDLFLQDDIENYYQNLKANESKAIGQKYDDMLAYCGVSDGKKDVMGLLPICKFRIKEFSLARYFNCFTVDIKSVNFSKTVSEIQLMFYLGASDDNTIGQKDGLLGNLFLNSRGIKLKLHERNLYPDMANGGINIGPGLSTLVSFKTYRFNELNLKTKRCYEETSTQHFKITDAKFNASFHYSLEACISAELDRIVLQKCGCVWPTHLNSQLPNETHRFCGELHHANARISSDRLNCVLQLNMTMLVEEVAQSKCNQRCNYFKYMTSHSSAEWLPKSWQLYWMHRVSRAFQKLKTDNSSSISSDALRTIRKYINASVISQRPTNADDQQWLNLEKVNDYTLVRIQRTSFETLHTEEKLSVTFSTFVSRIGGMGSVTLGINIALFVELLEWWFLSGVAVREKRREICERKRGLDSENEDETLPMTVAATT